MFHRMDFALESGFTVYTEIGKRAMFHKLACVIDFVRFSLHLRHRSVAVLT